MGALVRDRLMPVAPTPVPFIVTVASSSATLTLLPLLLAIRPSRRKTERTTLAFQPSFATRNFRSTSNGVGPDPRYPFFETSTELRRYTGPKPNQLNEVADDINLTLLAAVSLKGSNPLNFTPCESIHAAPRASLPSLPLGPLLLNAI
jgi:hypothetical protein